jgi:hypothetical protein
MTVVVFSKNPNASRMKFPRRPRTGPQVEVEPVGRLRKVLPALEPGQLVYLDMTGLGELERRRALAVLARSTGLYFGVIDPMGRVSDVASLFHAGTVDYIGREFRRTGLGARRLERVMAFARTARAQPSLQTAALPADQQAREAGPDRWAGVVPGREHTFAFLFVEVDSVEAMKRRSGAENLSRAMETFRAFIERMVTPHDGRLWTWAGFGGLVLFPLRARGCADDREQAGPGSPVLCGLRIALSRILYDVEESPLPVILSFRMALSTGSMIYSEKDTGGVVAESLNEIFHLGQKFARPGQFVLTEGALELAHERLRCCCVPAGTFEGRRIHRMVTPRYPAFQKEGEWPAGV